MTIYTHTLTEIEEACGVTLEAVAELLPKGLLISAGSRFILPANVAPALAGSTARCAFGKPAEFDGLNLLSQPIYRAVSV